MTDEEEIYIEEFAINNMTVSGGIDSKNGLNIRFPSHGENYAHIWF
jgi:hypothetical protein